MLGKLTEFRDSANKYLTGVATADLASIAEHGLDTMLDRAFEGLIVTSSSLANKSGETPLSLIVTLERLVHEGIHLIVIHDAPVQVLEGRVKDLANVFWLRIDNGRQDASQLAGQIGRHVDEQGYRLGKIAAAVSLHRPNSLVDKLVRALGIQTAFVTDFQPVDLQERNLVYLPIVTSDGALLSGAAATEHIATSMVFARQINVRETAAFIRNRTVRDKLNQVSLQAQVNLREASRLLTDRYTHLGRGDIFDQRSGAVCFTPFEWQHLSEEILSGHADVLRYFEEPLISYWQPGRPCLRRILYTPTKVLLRGEQYYVHMKNISPLDRIGEMISELGRMQSLQQPFTSLVSASAIHPGGRPWKLCLAFLDQLRNIGLQFFSFAHAADSMLERNREPGNAHIAGTAAMHDRIRAVWKSSESHLHSFVGLAVRAYYYWLLGDAQKTSLAFEGALIQAQTVSPKLSELRMPLEEWLSDPGMEPERHRMDRLVRRWREADLPGENLLVALVALRDVADSAVIDAVGIGWGGIELPLVFRYLAKLEGVVAARDKHLSTYIANWSHYGDGEARTSWVSFPQHHTDEPEFGAPVSVLFDDNVLTGRTLERIRDEMLLRGAKDVRIYVTRFSGERRLAHMKMEDHGVVDPDFLLNNVKGYLGETAFSRSWSTKKGDYRSQVGVFSLARRRILECIHNNSTAETWDREGF